MGGCTSSKYAADEDGKTTDKKEKKSNGLLKIKVGKKDKVNGKVESSDKKVDESKQKSPDNNKEDISFIDDETRKEDDDQKKEVTTYQTTVVKHTQKEGNELLAHLKEEAFRTLQGAIKQHQNGSSTSSPAVTVLSQTTNASVTDNNNTTTTSSSTTSPDDDLLKQVKDQVVAAIGKNKEEQILAIIQSGSELIKDNKVNSMSELEAELEKLYPSSEEEKASATTTGSPNSGLVSRIINATTGFLTAKGTEAGAMLSNILANANAGLTGVLNETEKTTVKVTRTVTEQIITTNGQIKEITKTITSNEPLEPGQNIQDIIKNLATTGRTTTTGTTSSTANTQVTEKHEPAAEELADQAEKVVNHVVTTAVEKVIDEQHQQQNGHHNEEDAAVPGHQTESSSSSQPLVETTENVKIEEESSVKVSTTKIVLNGDGSVASAETTTVNGKLEQVQGEFYQNGKHDAEEAVKKTVVNSDEEEEASVAPVANES